MTISPPRPVDSVALSRAVDACIDALGADAVIAEVGAMREFRDPFYYRESEDFDASAAVLPSTTEQVQTVVRIANEHRVPLWTFGQGHNVTYGGPAPRLRGSILLNLRRMNRVLEVNSELAYAVVEPGVQWFDLHAALEAEGSGLWTSLSDLGFGSVVGNAVEYGIGYTPYGDHAAAVCGFEVVLPDGSLLRTGMGAQPDNPSWHVYPHSYGPAFGGLFHQSNLGIVTRMGFWVMPRPKSYAACRLTLVGYDALEAVIDAMRELMLERTIENNPLFMRGYDFDDDGGFTINLASDGWIGRFSLYGREPLVDVQYATVQERLARIPGVTLTRRTFSGDDVTSMADHYERVQRGIPDMDMLNPAVLPFGEFTGHLDFSPVVPMIGSELVRVEQAARAHYARHRQPCRTAIIMRPRSALQLSTTFFDTRNEQVTGAAYAGYGALIEEMAGLGYAPYRTNLPNMDGVADQFSFGDHAQRRLAETIKDVLDPNGILSPGKSGIWPAAHRNGSAD